MDIWIVLIIVVLSSGMNFLYMMIQFQQVRDKIGHEERMQQRRMARLKQIADVSEIQFNGRT